FSVARLVGNEMQIVAEGVGSIEEARRIAAGEDVAPEPATESTVQPTTPEPVEAAVQPEEAVAPEPEPTTIPGTAPHPQAGEIALLPASELRRDAARFQYKDSDEQGVTDRLRRVGKFDPNLAGVLLVWRDPA